MHRSGIVASLLSVGIAVTVGCSSDSAPDEDIALASPTTASNTGECGGGGLVMESNAPDAVCAIRLEYNVPDLALGDAPMPARDELVDHVPAGDVDMNIGTRTLSPLDRSGTEVTSCNGQTGPGFTTCGAQGNDNCCRARTIPAGRSGTVSVATAFDMGVYEVTSGRFQAFVAAFDGNLQNAARSGRIPGVGADIASALPTSRAQADRMLGPECQARSQVDDYGARTWPSAEIEQTVARLMSDDNARAADIRADATASRLSAKPITCVSYQMAAAFCAWDGGRLPRNDEWAYVALGAGQGAVRVYPWGSGRTKERIVTDLTGTNSDQFTYPEDFPFYSNGMNAYHIAPPGRKPAGAAAFGIQDMGGNVLEWVADRSSATMGAVRGGSWEGHRDENDFVYVNYPLDRSYGSLGFRCAYGSSAAPAPEPTPPVPNPAPPADQQDVHRAYNGTLRDHVMGLGKNEGAPAWAYEGVAFRTLARQITGTVPLYRCLTNSREHHFLSNASNCEGHIVEGNVGFVYAAQAQGTLAIYRCASATGTDHVTTTNPAECTNAGFRNEGRQGFAFAVPGALPPLPAPPAVACGHLGVNAALAAGQELSSCDGRFVLIMQRDGNLVLYRRNPGGAEALWHTVTGGTTINRAIMQGDGNFVLYDAQNRAPWHSHTHGNPGASLVVQDDGNVVIYSPAGRALWHTMTGGR